MKKMQQLIIISALLAPLALVGYAEASTPAHYNSCVDALKHGVSDSGTYQIGDYGQVYCDMRTDGGGWMAITPRIAKEELNGELVTHADGGMVDSGFDNEGRPYTRDDTGGHTAYYTFDLPRSVKSFFLKDYAAKSNAHNDSADIFPVRFKQSSWSSAAESSVGDVSFGFADESGPVTSFAHELTGSNCTENISGDSGFCYHDGQLAHWPKDGKVYTTSSRHSKFRIGWGDVGQPSEGWYPWWSGHIMVRDGSPFVAVKVKDIDIESDQDVDIVARVAGFSEDPDAKMRVEYEGDVGGDCNGPWSKATLKSSAGATYDDDDGRPSVDNDDSYQVGSDTDRRIVTTQGPNDVSITWDATADLGSDLEGKYCIRVTVRNDDGDEDEDTEIIEFTKRIEPTPQPQPNPRPQPGGLCTAYITKYMKLGAYNDPTEVMKLQQYLNAREGEHLAVNGVYDYLTYEAVKRYQAKYAQEILYPWGIRVPSGYVYKTTINHINRQMCSGQIQCPVFTQYHKLGDFGGEVPKIQQFLKMYGYYAGPITGYYDAATDAGIRAFQWEFRPMILTPWNLTQPTGRWYKTSRKHANWLQGCFEQVYLEGVGIVF